MALQYGWQRKSRYSESALLFLFFVCLFSIDTYRQCLVYVHGVEYLSAMCSYFYRPESFIPYFLERSKWEVSKVHVSNSAKAFLNNSAQAHTEVSMFVANILKCFGIQRRERVRRSGLVREARLCFSNKRTWKSQCVNTEKPSVCLEVTLSNDSTLTLAATLVFHVHWGRGWKSV